MRAPLTRSDDPLVPLHLLIFSVEVAVSTLVCTLEMLSWEGYSAEEQKQLSALYMPYLGLGKYKPTAEWYAESNLTSNLDGH